MSPSSLAGTLHVVATPIGNLNDLSPRAQETLRGVSAICAEDTRHTRQLLSYFGIEQSLVALHEHNEAGLAERIVARLQAGESLALVSDAGTPLVSDPGFRLVAAARAAFSGSETDFGPHVQTAAGYTVSKEQQPGFTSQRIKAEGYSAGFDAAWELDLFGHVRRNVEAARADLGAQQEQLREAQIGIAAEVARNYFALRGWQAKDVFLADDYLIKQRFAGMTPAQIRRYAERWQPWRSYALLHIWYTDGWSPSVDAEVAGIQ